MNSQHLLPKINMRKVILRRVLQARKVKAQSINPLKPNRKTVLLYLNRIASRNNSPLTVSILLPIIGIEFLNPNNPIGTLSSNNGSS